MSTNSSCFECACLSADTPPGLSRVRFTPRFERPNTSPSGRYSRGRPCERRTARDSWTVWCAARLRARLIASGDPGFTGLLIRVVRRAHQGADRGALETQPLCLLFVFLEH